MNSTKDGLDSRLSIHLNSEISNTAVNERTYLSVLQAARW